MKTVGYYNGIIDELENIRIPLLDRAGYFGDGVYDAALARNGRIFALDDHIHRFYRSAGLVGMEVPMTKDALAALLYDLLRRMDDPNAMVYWQLSRGTAPRSHAFPSNATPNLTVMLTPKQVGDVRSRSRMLTTEDNRYALCHIKTLNLLPNVLAAEKARAAGCDGAIFVREGIVTECDHSNVHILQSGRLITHPADHRILPGIARKHLLSVCGTLDIPVEERPFTCDEMMTADEVLISGTTQLVHPTAEIDGRPVGGRGGALLERLLDAVLAEYLDETDA